MLQTIAIALVKNAMVAMMLAVGLSTTPRQLRATWAERALVVRALLVVELGVPLLALATVRILPLRYATTAIITTMAVCPGAPMILRQIRDRPVILVVLAVTSLLAPISLPIWIALLSRALPHTLFVDVATVVNIMVVKQVLPLAAGVAIAWLLPRLARPLARFSWAVFVTGFALALVVVLVKGAPALWQIGGWEALAVIIVVAGSIAMGYLAGRPRPDDSFALAVIAVLGNPALGAAVIGQSYPTLPALALVAAYVLARTVALLPYVVHAHRQYARRHPETTPGLRGLLRRPAVSGNHP